MVSLKDEFPVIHSEQELGKALKADRVVALFYASWGPFCVKVLPAFQKSTQGEGRHLIVVQDDQETMAETYAVKVYPTLLCFEKGAVTRRLDGVLGIGISEKDLKAFVDSCPRA
jgi:thiol-disulfide isomerase/thioredoxin